MKQNRYFIITSLIFLACFWQAGGQTYSEGDLLGTWAFDYNASYARMEPSRRSHVDGMGGALKQKFEGSYRGRTYEFRPGGACVLRLSSGAQLEGRWRLDQNSSTLSLIFGEEDRQTYTIRSLNPATMVLEPLPDGNGKLIITKWHLRKN